MTVWITLTPQEIELCAKHGTDRNKNKRSSGVRNKQVANGSADRINIDGVIGEFAFCKAFGLPPDLVVHNIPGLPDVVWPDGTRCDIKATRHARGRLMLYKPKHGENTYDNIDAFILARLQNLPEVELVGYAYKRDIMRPERIEDVGYGPTYFFPTFLLHNFSEAACLREPK